MTAQDILSKAADDINISCPKVCATYTKTRGSISLRLTRDARFEVLAYFEMANDAPAQSARHATQAAQHVAYKVQDEGARVDASSEKGGAV